MDYTPPPSSQPYSRTYETPRIDPRFEVRPDPKPGQSNVYDRDGHRIGTLERQPDGREIYRDFQTGRVQTR